MDNRRSARRAGIVTILAAAAMLIGQNAQASTCATLGVSLTINGTTYNPSACVGNVNNYMRTIDTETLNILLSMPFVYLDISDDDATLARTVGSVTFQVGEVSGNSVPWTVSWTEKWADTADFDAGLYRGGDATLLPLKDRGINGSGDLVDYMPFPSMSYSYFGAGAVFTLANSSQPTVTVADPTVAPVPEPASLALLASALIGFGLLRRGEKRRIA